MELLRISIDETGNIQFATHWLIPVLVAVGVLLLLIFRKLSQRIEAHLELDEAEIGIGTGKLKFKANIEDLQVGYMFWVELATRKLGLPIDEENDVIVEVYNSWYEFFRSARELIKSIPVSKVRANESTREIVRVSVQILNNDLRPHLTKWQAKYRRWLDIEMKKSENEYLSPQEIQCKFPEYANLMSELRQVNARLTAYKMGLKTMIAGDKSL
jgi:hypothetical protein